MRFPKPGTNHRGITSVAAPAPLLSLRDRGPCMHDTGLLLLVGLLGLLLLLLRLLLLLLLLLLLDVLLLIWGGRVHLAAGCHGRVCGLGGLHAGEAGGIHLLGTGGGLMVVEHLLSWVHLLLGVRALVCGVVGLYGRGHLLALGSLEGGRVLGRV
jgi:hypothetical protein